jgi:acyl carrier protein
MSNPSKSPSVEESIRSFVAQNLLYAEGDFPYSDDASFLQEGIVDSLGVMQLVEFVAKAFELKVDQQEVTPENFDSVTKLAGFVRRKVQARSTTK